MAQLRWIRFIPWTRSCSMCPAVVSFDRPLRLYHCRRPLLLLLSRKVCPRLSEDSTKEVMLLPQTQCAWCMMCRSCPRRQLASRHGLRRTSSGQSACRSHASPARRTRQTFRWATGSGWQTLPGVVCGRWRQCRGSGGVLEWRLPLLMSVLGALLLPCRAEYLLLRVARRTAAQTAAL